MGEIVMSNNKPLSLSDMELAQSLQSLNEIQAELNYTPKPVAKDKLLLAILNRIPFLTGLLNSFDKAGTAASKLVEVTGHISTGVQNASTGFQYLGLAIDSLNFIRIPLIYLAAFIIGEKPPINLTNNAKWLYSAVVLALAIVAVTVPVTAPFIAIGAAALAFGVSAFTLGKFIYEHHQLKKAEKQLTAEISKAEEALAEYKQQAETLEQKLKTDPDPEEYKALLEQVEDLKKNYDVKAKQLMKLQDKKLENDSKLKEMGWIKGLDKGVTLVLGAVAVIGAVLTLYFPPVGLGILAGAAVLGGLYAVGRMTAPLFSKLGGWIMSKFKGEQITPPQTDKDNDLGAKLGAALGDSSQKQAELKSDSEKLSLLDDEHSNIVQSENHDLGSKVQIKPSLEDRMELKSGSEKVDLPANIHSEPKLVVDSTLAAMQKMHVSDLHPEEVFEQLHQDELLGAIDDKLGRSVVSHNLPRLVEALKELAKQKVDSSDIEAMENWDKAVEIFAEMQAQSNLVSREDLSQLAASKSLQEALQTKGIQLESPVKMSELKPVNAVHSSVEKQQQSDEDDEGEGIHKGETEKVEILMGKN